MANILAIVGRPNVGKSTLFNRLVGGRKAIVDEIAGVTRDRHYGKSDWNGIEFSVIDTGGYITGSDDVFEGEIRRQVELGISEAQVIFFVVSVEDGITHLDNEVASILRKSRKKVFLVVNKTDNTERLNASPEFYSMGLGEIYPISSINGSGTGELLDEAVKFFENEPLPAEKGIPRVAISGRPNVGKSSFLNALLGTERSIVTPIAGTTRDSIDTRYNFYGHEFILIDTAGIRKKSKVKEDIEFYSVMRSIRAIEECDIVFLMLDATLGFESQDMNIFKLAVTNRKGIVILVNKWDLVEKSTNTMKEFEAELRNKIAPFRDVPIVFISALSKQRIMKAVEVMQEVFENKKRRIPTNALNEFILPLIATRPPPSMKGKEIRIKFARQLPGKNPNFALYCNLPQYVRESYVRFIENKIRENYSFTGVPIEIVLKKK
jgi:GTPase